MKAALNAIPQLSTLDGWWAEGYTGLNGWALPVSTGTKDPDAVDAENLYALLEKEVIPLYYDVDEEGLARGWLQRMKHSLYEAGRSFTAARMIREYAGTAYVPAIQGTTDGDEPPI
jgi:starch phosphorylase